MSRPLRIEEPGLWHHVMNRGLDRRVLFRVEADHVDFLDLVGQIGPRWNVWCHALVLMGNHYHILLQDEGGRLSRAMRHIDGVFTQKFNHRHNRDGPLMRGRYRSRLVDDETYLLEVIRYIHINPVKAGRVDRAGDYQWSSHRQYLAPEAPQWLRRDAVFERFGCEPGGVASFDEFVHERIPDAMKAKLEPKRWMSVLGSAKFEDRWKQAVRDRGLHRRRELSEARRLTAIPVDDVIVAACDVFEVEVSDMQEGRRGEFNAPRQLALMVCRERCSVGNDELGARFGIAGSSVSTLVRRTRMRLQRDAKLRSALEALESGVQVKSQVAT